MLNRLLNLDIFDLTYEYNEHVHILSMPSSVLPRSGLLLRVVIYFFHMFKSLVHSITSFPLKPVSKNSVLFFVYSTNQRNALLPVAEKIPNSYLTGNYLVSTDFPFPLFWAHVLSLPFLPLVLVKLWNTHGYRRKTIKYAFDQYWLTYGYYIISKLWLKRLAPSVVVVSNDHIMPCRVIIKVAKELGIPTIYLQHASVNLTFPPLSFDYAFLDGKDALRKYSQIGKSSTQVFLVGIPKIDTYLQYAKPKPGFQVIGVCTNPLDPIQRVETLCEYIHGAFPDLILILRPHPGDKRFVDWQKMANRKQMGFSDSRIQLSFEFLKCIDVAIVGESNILLEAALMNVTPLHYDFEQKARDEYGFIKNGMAKYTSKPEEIISQLNWLSKSNLTVQMKVKDYCDTVGTKYFGYSSLLVANLIQCIASGKQIDMQIWKRFLPSPLIAYELVSD